MLKDGQTNVHNEEQSGQPSVVSDKLVQRVDTSVSENQCFTISELLLDFPQISCNTYEVATKTRLPQLLHSMGTEDAYR